MSKFQAHSRVVALALTLVATAGCGGGAGSTPGTQQLLPPVSTSSTTERLTDDSDLSGGNGSVKAALTGRLQQEAVAREGQQLVFPTRTATLRGAAPVRRALANAFAVTGQLQYFDPKGATLPAENVTVSATVDRSAIATALVGADGNWTLSVDKRFTGKKLVVSFALANDRWVLQGDNAYAWQGPELTNLKGDTDTGARTLEKGSTNAQAAFIHEIWNRYMRLFTREHIDLGWWSRAIDTYWPADGDYYSGSVNLTEATHWDVNGHEIGHAITFTGTNTRAGGGQHYIDRCYSDSLAWSEGVASFFSAAVSIDPNDPDAKFEFMVPRRAPLRYENVPDDVCKGNGNEWRVGAAMWDVYDLHNDGKDAVGLSFATIWKALHEADSISGIRDVLPELIKKAGQDKANLIKDAFRQNTMQI